MISNQIIQNSISELKEITKVDLCVMDLDGTQAASTFNADNIKALSIRSFIDSQADSQVIQDCHLFRVIDDNVTAFVVVAKGMSEDVYTIGRVAVCELQNLITAYKERFDKNNFFQNLILDNLLLVDIYNRAKKLHIPVDAKRAVFIIEPMNEKDSNSIETLRTLFSSSQGDYITAVDEKDVILIKTLEDASIETELEQTAGMLVDMMNTEAMTRVRVAYGTVVNEIKQVSQSYKEAKMALDVGKIFFDERNVIAYSALGIGRLIYQLPIPLCKMFIKEIFKSKSPDEFDEETLTTINKFFENSLNVSETSRQLFIHRNTLVYRLDKLQKSTGLDLRVFDDAITFKIALMVVKYMKYMEKFDY